MKRIVLLLLLLSLLVGCSKKESDLAPYRGFTAAQIFNSAELALAKEDYGTAIKALNALDAIYPFGPYSRQGQLDIIYAYYMNDDVTSALAAASRYIRLYPRGKDVAYAYYMKGLVESKTGLTWLQRKFHADPAPHDLTNMKRAFTSFGEVVTLFPRSPYAPDAAFRMMAIRNIIARKQVLIAQFYLKRKAYIAAANRASFVVRHFNGSPEMIPALAVMVKSYRAMHLTYLEDSTLKIFQASYPNAPELKKLLPPQMVQKPRHRKKT